MTALGEGVRRAARWRKEDYAQYVMIITPICWAGSLIIFRSIKLMDSFCFQSSTGVWLRGVDMILHWGVIVLTVDQGFVHAAIQTQHQDRCASEERCLHPHPEKVTDPAFVESEFFDPRDLVQVKYEMLRRVRVDGLSVSKAASSFGLSRPSYYQAQAAFEDGGLPALLPKKPGPRRAHKLSDDVVTALRQALVERPELTTQELVKWVEEHFAISVHRRSIERALARQEKKLR